MALQTRNMTRADRKRLAGRDLRAEAAEAVMRDRKRRTGRDDLHELIAAHGEGGDRSRLYRRALRELADAVRRTKLIDPRERPDAGEYRQRRSYLHALAELARHHVIWVRRPADWVCRTHNTHRQFAALARHLLCDYSPPACFDAAWFNDDRSTGPVERSWFIWIGRGNSIRKAAGLPLDLTRRAAHLLAEAPAALTVRQSMRWAQLRAIGATDRLAAAMIASRIGVDFARDDFWLSVARFFIEQPMLDAARVGPIVDYLHHQRYERQGAALVNGMLTEAGPAQPNLTMRGRTLDTLTRQVEAWHTRLGRGPAFDASATWPTCGVAAFRRVEGEGANARLYTIQELRSARSLAAEGRAMRHCVASYTASCLRGYAAIFAMRVLHGGMERPVVTIEVHPATRRIVQARGRSNAKPEPTAERVIHAWASTARLTVVAF